MYLECRNASINRGYFCGVGATLVVQLSEPESVIVLRWQPSVRNEWEQVEFDATLRDRLVKEIKNIKRWSFGGVNKACVPLEASESFASPSHVTR